MNSPVVMYVWRRSCVEEKKHRLLQLFVEEGVANKKTIVTAIDSPFWYRYKTDPFFCDYLDVDFWFVTFLLLLVHHHLFPLR